MDEGDAVRGRSALWLALKELTEGRGIQRPDLLEALEAELSELRRCWGVNLMSGPNVAQDTIRFNLMAHFERITPPAPGPRSKQLSQKQHLDRYWLCIHVGFNTGLVKLPELLEMDISERRRWLEDPARGKMQVSVSTRQRYLVHIIDNIEKQIVAASYVPVSRKEITMGSLENPEHIEDTYPPSVSQPFYIRRSELHAQFKEFHNSDTKLIAFTGQAGMGKTWLARAVAAEHQRAAVPEVQFIDGRIDHITLRMALARQGIEVSTPVEGHEAEYLAQLVADKKAPAFLVLDNFETTDDLVRLRLRGSRSRIIATCRYEGKLPHSDWCCIPVEKMHDAEALEMIERRLPALEASEAAQLANQLGSYPLVIGYACTLLDEQHLTVAQFCSAVKRDAAQVARIIPTEEGVALFAVLGQMVDLIRERNILAYRLLAYMVLANTHGDTAAVVLKGYVGSLPRVDTISSNYIEAMRSLLGFAVVERVSIAEPGHEHAELPDSQRALLFDTYRMHQLTRSILQYRLKSELPHVRRQSISLLADVMYFEEATPGSELRIRHVGELLRRYTFKLLADVVIDDASTGTDVFELLVVPAIMLEVKKHYGVHLEHLLVLILIGGLSHAKETGDTRLADGVPLRWHAWAERYVVEHREEFRYVFDDKAVATFQESGLTPEITDYVITFDDTGKRIIRPPGEATP